MSTISHNKYICKGCNKTFIDCKCISICAGKFNKSDILMSFIKFGDKYDMKKVERERRQYFSDNYDKPKKRKFNVVKKIVIEPEPDYDVCGETGGHIDDCCGKEVLDRNDIIQIDDTSVCLECYDKLGIESVIRFWPRRRIHR